jgi:hypothetical protein
MPRRSNIFRFSSLLTLQLFWIFSCGPAGDPAPMTLQVARTTLRGYLEDVVGSTARRYRLSDDQGHSMDCLKVIAGPQPDQFVGVYHSYTRDDATFHVEIATSRDLLQWVWRATLANQASQATIQAATDGGYVVAWEQEPNNHLQFAYYQDWDDLLAGAAAKTFAAPQTLSDCAEGTPNIYSASSTTVEVGFHYYRNCDVDRQASGIMNWESWQAHELPELDTALENHGVRGNIGDRDGIFTFAGFQFSLIEGQSKKGDFGSWRTYLYDHQSHTAELLNIQTHAGSQAFANPTFAEVNLGGHPTLLITLYLPREGAQNAEAGPLLYYRVFPFEVRTD